MICQETCLEHCTEKTHQSGNAEINKKRDILTSLQPEQDCNTKNNYCSKYTSNTIARLPEIDKHDTSLSMVSEDERQKIYAYIYVKRHEPMIIVTSKEKIWTNTDKIINEEDDTNLKGVYSGNDKISSPDCGKEKRKEPSTNEAAFPESTGLGDINFLAVMDSSLEQVLTTRIAEISYKNTTVSEIDKTKNEAIKSQNISNENVLKNDKLEEEAMLMKGNTHESNEEIKTKVSSTKPDVSNQQKMGVVSKHVNIKKPTNHSDVQSSLCNREVTKNQERNSYMQSQKKQARNRSVRYEKFQFSGGLLKCELLTKIMFRLFIISLIVPKPITASCTLKITSIELEPPDILLYVNVSKDCDFKGVTKWEGGPDNTLLTFGNQSQHKSYQPVQRGSTFDLLIKNATQKEYNTTYSFHLKFKSISAYLPTLQVYPGKGCFQTHYHVVGKTLVVDVHVKAFPEPFFEIAFADMTLTEKQEKKLTNKKLFYEGNVNFTYQLPEKSCDGQLNINYYLGAVHGILLQKVIKSCSNSGIYPGTIVAIVMAIVFLLVMAICIFMYKKKCKKKWCIKKTDQDGTKKEGERLNESSNESEC